MEGKSDVWQRYDEWNEALVDVMFPTLADPEPVYMDFEDEQLYQLASRLGVPASDVEKQLAADVAATLGRGGPASIFDAHMRRVNPWARRGRKGTPPFVALLGAFCVAAERMQAGDGMSSANYFGRLRSVLGWDANDTRLDQGYRRVAERLWGELNRWLVEIDGHRGLPTAFALNHRFVGLTLSQALVRRGDRERLTEFFRQYGFAPGSDVAPSELALVLDSWIHQSPCPVSRTLERLWGQGQAKERIAQAAAVALAAWDGSFRGRVVPEGAAASTSLGQIALTLELGSFPRKRFAIAALLYLPESGEARDATVLTASPEVEIELIPDAPGALGLGRASALHAGDVLEGDLQIKDSLTERVVRRRPRRVVVFREDPMSRRWIETAQVMLGDNVRLLLQEDLAPRLELMLEGIARPGWQRLDPFPGQPDGWALFTDVEVFNHPGALIRKQGMDDLSPLVPLTSSQLKIADGFALPGHIRGKWHSWAPPEIRAISDNPDGFVVRVVDLKRYEEAGNDDQEEVIAEWGDDGAGVVVRSLRELGLGDGDYRVEVTINGESAPINTTTVHLRSSDTPDQRQWSSLTDITYGTGIGCLGIPSEREGVAVRGLVAPDVSPFQDTTSIPQEPWWLARPRKGRDTQNTVRLTMPDVESCLYTGKHREQIETVPTDAKGKPLVAWSVGRCRGCGLERRYPTRLRNSSFGGRAWTKAALPAPRQHDLSSIDEAARPERDWATAFDAILHTGGGSWAQLERIAFQMEASALFVDQLARTLEGLGHIDIKRHPQTLEPIAWEVAPTSLAGTANGYLFSGFWPDSLYVEVAAELEQVGVTLHSWEAPFGPPSYMAEGAPGMCEKVAEARDLPATPAAWQNLAAVLAPLSEVVAALPRQSDAVTGSITHYRPESNAWEAASDLAVPGGYRVRRFAVLDLLRTEEDVRRGTVARSTVQLTKHAVALMHHHPLVAYDAATRELAVPVGADLPGLYGRAAVAASGVPPREDRGTGSLVYGEVSAELAAHLYNLLSR